MAKQHKRKKLLKLSMKRKGLLSKASQVIDYTVEKVESFVDETITTGKDLVAKGTQKFDDLKTQDAKDSLEQFAAQEQLAGIRSDLVETLYTQGIHSVDTFSQWTEKELLALKGIGPATVEKLLENGVKLKK
ncbi:helix-hairpin-helix domain-containing protein [Streptococcus hongkongensis]|nr:hypothetical protein NC01_02860 [Streptococcus uberis]